MDVRQLQSEVMALGEESDKLAQATASAKTSLQESAMRIYALVNGSHTGERGAMAVYEAGNSIQDASNAISYMKHSCKDYLHTLSA